MDGSREPRARAGVRASVSARASVNAIFRTNNFRTIFRAVAKDRETGWAFTGVVAALYLAYLIVLHVHHEPWRDEIHAWTLSRLARGFADLVTGERRYEGHPPLWFWYLRVWSWLTPEIWGLQAATIAAALAAAVLLLRWAPFPRYLKVALLASYYFGYEYAVLSRNYVLGWLLVCLFCAAYHPLRVRHLALGVILGLLALTSVYGLIMAGALFLFIALEEVRLRRSAAAPPARFTLEARRSFLAAALVTLALFAFCVAFLEPSDPNLFAPGWRLADLNLGAAPRMLTRLTMAFLPVRQSGIGFWLSYNTVWTKGDPRLAVLGGAFLLATLLALARAWRPAIAYAAGVGLMAFVQQTRYDGHPRHLGHYYMLFLAACWLSRTLAPRRRHLPSLLMLVVLAGPHLQGFLVSAGSDFRWPFAGGRETAAFIQREKLQDLPIVAGESFEVLSVTGYLRRPFISVESEDVHETVVFHGHRRQFTGPNLVSRAVDLAREHQGPVLMISTRNLPPPPADFKSTLLFTARRGTIYDEVFRVYRLEAR